MKTMKLKTPVQIGAEPEIKSLDFETMRAKHIMKLKGEPSMEDMLVIAGNLCNQPKTVMQELCMEDLGAVIEHVGNEFAPFQAIGNQL